MQTHIVRIGGNRYGTVDWERDREPRVYRPGLADEVRRDPNAAFDNRMGRTETYKIAAELTKNPAERAKLLRLAAQAEYEAGLIVDLVG